MLLAELTRDMALYLRDQGHVTAINMDVFLDNRPDKPDNLVSIYDTGGFPAEQAITDLKRTAQMLIRDKSYDAARIKAWDIYKALDKPGNRVIISNGRKMLVKAVQPPTFLNRDASDRALFVFNIQMWTSRD